jgi:site-specific DNA-methyltransferase (adenine-specific)
MNLIYNEDCLKGMRRIPDGSVDMVLCDLPYGTTACAWDSVIPFEPLWAQYRRVAKENAAIVLTASQPFTTALISSNLNHFRYALVWDKKITGNPFLAKFQPLKTHEDVCVFSATTHKYYPQMTTGDFRKKGGGRTNLFNKKHAQSVIGDQYYPTSIIDASNAVRGDHPTQKPVELFEYLIRTYTQPGETVLDNCMGSGTTAIAALRSGRQYIGFEKDTTYHSLACKRIDDYLAQGRLF